MKTLITYRMIDDTLLNTFYIEKRYKIMRNYGIKKKVVNIPHYTFERYTMKILQNKKNTDALLYTKKTHCIW